MKDLSDLPKFQKERFWNLVENIGHGPDSTLTNVPVAVTPDKDWVLLVNVHPCRDTSKEPAGSIEVSVGHYYKKETIENLPVMDIHSMSHLVR